jgi:rare lipoprotein A
MKRLAIAFATMALLAAGCASSRKPGPETVPMSGLASWYGQEYAGRLTANGEIFDPSRLTAAHRTLPFGTVVRVTNPKNGKSVDVRINDRGPFIANRIIDLSWAAAAALDMVKDGVAPVELAIVRTGAGDLEPPKPLIVSIPGSTAPVPTPSASAPKNVAGTPAPAPERSDSIAAQAIHDLGATIPPPKVDFPIPDSRPSAAASTPPAPFTETRPSTSPDATPVIVEKVPAPAPSALPPAAREPAGPAWSLQLGAFGVEENARKLQERAAAVTPNVQVVLVGGLYRVRVGPFTSRVAAIEMRERLDAAGFTTYMVSE